MQGLLRGEKVAQISKSSQIQSLDPGRQSSCFGTPIAIAQGSSSLIELMRSDSTLIIPPGRIAGLYAGTEIQNARCVIEVTPVEFGDGWAVVRFLPQIHHGTMATRYSVSGVREQLPVRQKIQPLYEQQFELKLHTGETLVIGHLQQEEWTVGQAMFRSRTLSSATENLVILQMNDIEEIRGRNSLELEYSR
ncbi:MAG: hypothetical protein R3C49_11950 [Planctomycetaceae bacterium]